MYILNQKTSWLKVLALNQWAKMSCIAYYRLWILLYWYLHFLSSMQIQVAHIFRHRLNSSVVHASNYLNQFPSPLISTIAKFISFVSGGFAAILIIIAFLDESLLEGQVRVSITSPRIWRKYLCIREWWNEIELYWMCRSFGATCFGMLLFLEQWLLSPGRWWLMSFMFLILKGQWPLLLNRCIICRRDGGEEKILMQFEQSSKLSFR